MRIWPILAVVTAGVSLAAIFTLVVEDWPASRWLVFGLGLGALLFCTLTWLVARGEIVARHFDRNGPVAPTGRPPKGATWSFDQYAGALADLVAPEEGLVYAYPRRRLLRIVLRPRTSITLHVRSVRDEPGRLVANYKTSWITVRLPARSAPRFLNGNGVVGARIDATGRLVPVWVPGFDSRSSTEQALAEANGYASTVFGRADYRRARAQAVELAVEAGLVAPDEIPTVEEVPTATETPTAEDRERADRRSDRVFVIVPAAVAGLCLVAAIITLLAGAPWWVAVIIVGGGLFFAAAFAVPLLLMRKMTEASEARSRRMRGGPSV